MITDPVVVIASDVVVAGAEGEVVGIDDDVGAGAAVAGVSVVIRPEHDTNDARSRTTNRRPSGRGDRLRKPSVMSAWR